MKVSRALLALALLATLGTVVVAQEHEPAPSQAPAADHAGTADAHDAHGGGNRQGDTTLFFELFEHLEPHPVAGLWFGGSEGFSLVPPYEAGPDGAPLHGTAEHPEKFHDAGAFEEHYRAALGGGWGFMIYNINTVMWIAALLVLLLFVPVARKARSRHGEAPRGAFQGAMEAIVLFVRDEMVYAVMGKQRGRRFLPLFLTMFFFILSMNLLGLVALGDLGGAATANLAVTLGMATISFFWIQLAGIREYGFFKHWANYVPKVPWWVLPIIVPVEAMGIIIKPAALTIRLTANMNAGHLLVLSLFGLIYFANSYAIGAAVWAGAIGIYMLETLVAFVQAYIFTYLTIVFVDATVHPEH